MRDCPFLLPEITARLLPILALAGACGHPASPPAPEVVPMAAPAPPLESGPAPAKPTEEEAERQVTEVIRAGSLEVKQCYELRLRELPSLEGRIAVDLVIERGVVSSAVAAEDSIGDPALTGCILERVRGWRFPPEITDKVYLPFALRPR